MDICPQCNSLLLKNKQESFDERLCLRCGWKGRIWREGDKVYGQLDKVLTPTTEA